MSDALVSLGCWPTPLQRLDRLARKLGGVPLYAKRDDLSGFGFAGTKARSLEHLLGDAIGGSADTVVVGGGPASNLVPATAGAARVCGLACVAVLYGPPTAAHTNLSLTRWLGAEVRFTNTADRSSVDRELPQVAAELVTAGRRPYVVPRGGATPVGAAGTARAVTELATQVDALGLPPPTVVVATGSGGIHAGLLVGIHAASLPWRVVGMSVSRPPGEVRGRVADLATETTAHLGLPPADAWPVELRDVRGDGYGLPSPDGIESARLAAHTEGLLLDQTYTAKAWAGLPDLLAEGVEGPVVLWHTGGTGAALATLSEVATEPR